MTVNLPDLGALVPRTAAALDRDGFACLEGAVSMDWVESARNHVRAHLDRHGQKFFSLIRPGDDAGSPFDRLVHDPAVVDLLRGLTSAACPRGLPESGDIYNVLRVIAGPGGTSGSCEFHFDASVVTLLVPIFMPDPAKGPSGELITFANRRPYRRFAIANLAEKALVQNRLAWRRTAQELPANDSNVRLLQPGNMYLFWGYRTYHGNLPCAPDTLRATLLLHYGDPHGNTPLMRSVKRLRRMVEVRRLRKA